MEWITTEFCQRLRDARRAKHLTQAELAERVDCKQSAVSMMEAGRVTALAHETVSKIAAELGVPMEKAKASHADKSAASASGSAHCPDPECFSNVPLVVNGSLLFWPRPQPVAGGVHCAICGEVLVRVCPRCGAPAATGACCRHCGASYIAPPDTGGQDIETWAAARRQRIAEWRALL
jgi:DNA-binding XRE family transcriptional regulator